MVVIIFCTKNAYHDKYKIWQWKQDINKADDNDTINYNEVNDVVNTSNYSLLMSITTTKTV